MILAGCGGDDDPTGPEPVEGVIVPLAVGNHWIFTVYDFSGGGTPDSTVDSIVVMGTATVGSETRYLLNQGTEQMVNRGNGLYYQPSGATQPYLLFAYPADVGSGWQSGPSGATPITLLSRSEQVTVPEGDYTCWQYVAEEPSGGLTVYYVAPNVGIIRYDRWDDSWQILQSAGLLADLHLE